MSLTHQAQEDYRNKEILVNVNGQLVSREEATVSVYDSGFMMGDGIWEGLRLYNGKWAFLEEHLERLFEAAKAVDIEVGINAKEIFQRLEDTRNANSMYNDVHARLMVTRGKKVRPFQHPSLCLYGSTVVIIMEHSKTVENLSRKGIRLATVSQIRGLPTSQDPKLNSHSKLNCILACIQAEKAGADEALMLDPNGFVCTTNSCNFFLVKNGHVWTSTGDYCMNGITRKKVIQICFEQKIPCFERNFSLVDTYSADEAFLTGTFGGQTYVSEIDGRQISDGKIGEITRYIKNMYKDMIINGK